MNKFKLSIFLFLLSFFEPVSSNELDHPFDVHQQKIVNKIEFMEGCKKENIKFTCLTHSELKVCSEYGVDACGIKYIYSYQLNNWIQTESELESKSIIK